MQRLVPHLAPRPMPPDQTARSVARGGKKPLQGKPRRRGCAEASGRSCPGVMTVVRPPWRPATISGSFRGGRDVRHFAARFADLLTDNIDWPSLRAIEQFGDVEPDEAEH